MDKREEILKKHLEWQNGKGLYYSDNGQFGDFKLATQRIVLPAMSEYAAPLEAEIKALREEVERLRGSLNKIANFSMLNIAEDAVVEIAIEVLNNPQTPPTL